VNDQIDLPPDCRLAVPSYVGEVGITETQWDDLCAHKLAAALTYAQDKVGYNLTTLWGILSTVEGAVMHTWSAEQQPPLVVTLGARFLNDYYASGQPLAVICEADHPLVVANLVDSGEVWAYTLELFSKERLEIHGGPRLAFIILGQESHSSVRWLDHAGDRTIVVLPPAYDTP
jgi:hypothetical protein